MVSDHLTSMSFPQVGGWSTDPRVLGRYSLVSDESKNSFIFKPIFKYISILKVQFNIKL